MKAGLAYLICITFALLGVTELIGGNPRIAVASVCLGVANCLLLL